MRAGHRSLATWTCRRQCRASRGVDRYRTPFGVDRIRKKSQSPISSVRLRGNNVDAFLRARGRHTACASRTEARDSVGASETRVEVTCRRRRALPTSPPRTARPRPRGDGHGKAAGNRASRHADFRGCRILGSRERSRVRGHDHPDHLGRDLECRERRADDGRRHAVARARARPRPRRGRRAGGVVPAQPRQPQARGGVGGDPRRAARRGSRRGGGGARRGEARGSGGGSTASSSDSEEPHDAAGRTASSALETDPSDAPRRADMAFAKKKRGFFGSSYFARASGARAGALAGGVAAGPLAPFGLVAGAAAGYYSSAKLASELKSRRHWFRVVAAAMGPEYVPVQTATLLQMRLIVFAKRVTVMDKNLIQNTRVGYQATGLLNAVGNKGGLMVRLALADGGSVAFVACHLAAHEGEKHVAARDESVAAILRGCWESSAVRAVGETDVGPTADADDGRRPSRAENDASNPSFSLQKTHASDSAQASSVGPELLACTSHVFVFGDLNYRVDPGMVESSPESGLRTRKPAGVADGRNQTTRRAGPWSPPSRGSPRRRKRRKTPTPRFARATRAGVRAPSRRRRRRRSRRATPRSPPRRRGGSRGGSRWRIWRRGADGTHSPKATSFFGKSRADARCELFLRRRFRSRPRSSSRRSTETRRRRTPSSSLTPWKNETRKTHASTRKNVFPRGATACWRAR